MRTEIQEQIDTAFKYWLDEELSDYYGNYRQTVDENYGAVTDWDEVLNEYVNEDPRISMHMAYEAGVKYGLTVNQKKIEKLEHDRDEVSKGPSGLGANY